MTLVAHIVCAEGVAVSADSVGSTSHSAGDLLARQGFDIASTTGPTLTVPLTDGERKIAILRDRYILTAAGVLPGATAWTTLDAIAADPAVATADDSDAMGRAVRAAIARHCAAAASTGAGGMNAALGTVFTFAYRREDDGVFCLDVLAGDHGQPLNWDAQKGERACGRFLLGQHQLVEQMLARLDLPVIHYPLPTAVAFSRWVAQLARDVLQFTPGLKLVAGPVLTAVLDADGARMLHPRRIELRDYGLAAGDGA